jgi:hypothetical protein
VNWIEVTKIHAEASALAARFAAIDPLSLDKHVEVESTVVAHAFMQTIASLTGDVKPGYEVGAVASLGSIAKYAAGELETRAKAVLVEVEALEAARASRAPS